MSDERLAKLLDRVNAAGGREDFLGACLDLLVEELGAQRGLVFQTSPNGVAVVLAARGPKRDLSPVERAEISTSILAEAERRGETIRWEADRGTASMRALTITQALAAPLRAFGGRGILYLDFRDVLAEIGEAELALFRAAAALVSIVIAQDQRLSDAREDLRSALAREPDALPSLDELLFPPSMAPIRKELESALLGESAILVIGESGTGKTVLARAVAEASGRTPLVRATLGSSDDLNTIASELFGHERGAFSGAISRRVGLVEMARGGTLILDEILNLPKHAQQLLLDFTQFHTFRPLGHEAAEPKRAKVRLISATNGDLDAAVADGRFRLDLFYRLAAVVLRIPPLRERSQEVPALAEAYLRRTDPRRDWRLSLGVRRLLSFPDLEWPGNVRQLEAVAQRARERALAADADATVLGPEHLTATDLGVSGVPAESGETAPATPDDLAARYESLRAQRDGLEDSEREIVRAALAQAGGVVSQAARDLRIPRSQLLSRLRALDLE